MLPFLKESTETEVIHFFRNLIVVKKASLALIGKPHFLDGLRIHTKLAGFTVQLSPPFHHYYVQGRGATLGAAAEAAYTNLQKDWTILASTPDNVAEATKYATEVTPYSKSLRETETVFEYHFHTSTKP